VSLRRTVYIALKSPKGAQKRKVTVFGPKFEQYSAIISKQYEIGCQLVSVTNRKKVAYWLSIDTDIEDLNGLR